MRRVGCALLLVARVAAADDDDRDYTLVDDSIEEVTAADERAIALTTTLLSQATGTTSTMPEGASVASVRAEANVAEIAGTREGYRFSLGGDGELRAGVGDVPQLAGSWSAHAGMEDTPLFDGGPHLGGFVTTFEMRRDYGALPSLRDGRELLRAPFDRSFYQVHFTFQRSRDDGSDWSGETVPLRFSSERTRQLSGDVAYQRQVITFDFAVFRLCYGPDSDLFCVRFVEGGVVAPVNASLQHSHWYPLGVEGVPLGRHTRLDARAGVLLGLYELPHPPLGMTPPPSPDSDCESRGECITEKTFGYDVTLRSLRAPHRLAATRRAYQEWGGLIAIEDRGTLSTSWQLRKTTLDASAYAAHTRWWAVVDDRFMRTHRAFTGGVDLTASRPLGKRWRVDGSLSVGRSFYGALDGAAPQAGFAAQGTLALAHELLSDWASLQRLRPAPPAI